MSARRDTAPQYPATDTPGPGSVTPVPHADASRVCRLEGVAGAATRPTVAVIENLKQLIGEYLDTLSDSREMRQERYLSPRGFAEDDLNDFLWWLEHK